MLQSFFSNTMSWLEDPYSPSLWNKVDSISHLRCKRLIDIRKTNINALFVRTRSLFLVTGGKYWMKQAPVNITMTSTYRVRSCYRRSHMQQQTQNDQWSGEKWTDDHIIFICVYRPESLHLSLSIWMRTMCQRWDNLLHHTSNENLNN